MPENVVSAILGLHAQTSLHPGAGTALGIVDLPVQRERHTRWPTIPGSSLKGVLRDACRERYKTEYAGDRQRTNQESPRLRAAFGPHTEAAGESAGALSLTDARLLAFPVRSLRGVFAWVTCPAVLDRLRRDLALCRFGSIDWQVPLVEKNRVMLPSDDCPCLIEGGRVALEEFLFVRAGDSDGLIAAWIADHVLPDSAAFDATRARFRRSLLVLHDDDFDHFAQYATEINARIGLDYETKTVKGKALFYEEYLPPETLFYALVLANEARARANGEHPSAGRAMGAADVFDVLRETLPEVLQVGADQSIGKGYCATRLARGRHD
ncbi:type III-B CRISPR module RAMP protein Cmr4 [Tautonia marina]|uniref:type III-B CRISPR module RAMP protein Cmr4 n=1 Tax=Tautonia marina TaxID=2653855 RepID=UPI0012608EBD|nr:type III-B CRISPR module RAMP protein Cmr4 [Tautonia marina]